MNENTYVYAFRIRLALAARNSVKWQIQYNREIVSMANTIHQYSINTATNIKVL